MRYIKLFEEFSKDESLNEGQIQVYAPGNPYKPEGSMTWPGVVEHLPSYLHPKAEAISERGIILGADFDFDKFIADPQYRSIPMGTGADKSLPKFLDKNPNYDEMEFDFIEIVRNPEKETRESWIKIADKSGIEFMIYPHMILDILKGGSVREQIYPGEKFLVDKMRAKIIDFGIVNPNTAKFEGIATGSKIVIVKMQDGETRYYTVEDWKKKNYLALDENKDQRKRLR